MTSRNCKIINVWYLCSQVICYAANRTNTVALYLIEKVLFNFSLLRCFFILFLLSSPKGIFLLLLESVERRERTIDVREKPWLVASHPPQIEECMYPDWGSNPQPRCVPWPGIKSSTSRLQDNVPTNWATLARARGVLNNKLMLNFIKCFSTSVEMIIWFFSFYHIIFLI